MIGIALAVGFVAVGAAFLLNLYRLLRGPDIVDRVLALDTIVINAIGLIVLATGYEGQGAAARRLFGDAVGDRIGQVWGFDAEGELHGMWRPTGQPGLWFHAGGLAQCRIFSKVLALQIKARELGLVG